MPVPANLVHQTTAGTGTGNLTLAAVNGKQAFSTVFTAGTANEFDYFISSRDAAEWERGTGTISAGALVRNTVIESSNAGAAVNFSAGTKDVINDIPAAKQVTTDTTQTLLLKTLTSPLITTNISPTTTDAAALGTTSLMFSDLFLASGGVVNWNNGTYTATQVGATLAVSGSVYFGIANPVVSNTVGWIASATGTYQATADGTISGAFNRKTSDGNIIQLYQDGTLEGSITVSGTTIAYNAFCGAHWSQLHDGGVADILRGTVVDVIDDLCSWGGEANDQLARFEISITPKSTSVYGVFMAWDADDQESNDAYIASLGAFVVRIGAGLAVKRGDLLESNGDGCARSQSDDLVRSSTIGKVTSPTRIETYADGSYLVPCVLYCG